VSPENQDDDCKQQLPHEGLSCIDSGTVEVVGMSAAVAVADCPRCGTVLGEAAILDATTYECVCCNHRYRVDEVAYE